jgi:BON domain
MAPRGRDREQHDETRDIQRQADFDYDRSRSSSAGRERQEYEGDARWGGYRDHPGQPGREEYGPYERGGQRREGRGQPQWGGESGGRFGRADDPRRFSGTGDFREVYGGRQSEGTGQRQYPGFYGQSEGYADEAPRRFRMESQSRWSPEGGSGRPPERGAHFGTGPKGYRRSDERIREDVCECLYHQGDIDVSEAEVTVRDGQVTLTGTVSSRRAKRMVEEIIDDVAGVTDVHNQLRVQEGSDRAGARTESESGPGNGRSVGSANAGQGSSRGR